MQIVPHSGLQVFHAYRRLCKASIQEKEKDDVLDGLDNEQFAFKKPKFQAFIGQVSLADIEKNGRPIVCQHNLHVVKAESGAKRAFLKCAPFVTSREAYCLILQSEKGQQLRAFRQIERLEEGHLLIQPLRQEHLSAATDLLTVTFADAIGYMPMYR